MPLPAVSFQPKKHRVLLPSLRSLATCGVGADHLGVPWHRKKSGPYLKRRTARFFPSWPFLGCFYSWPLKRGYISDLHFWDIKGVTWKKLVGVISPVSPVELWGSYLLTGRTGPTSKCQLIDYCCLIWQPKGWIHWNVSLKFHHFFEIGNRAQEKSCGAWSEINANKKCFDFFQASFLFCILPWESTTFILRGYKAISYSVTSIVLRPETDHLLHFIYCNFGVSIRWSIFFSNDEIRDVSVEGCYPSIQLWTDGESNSSEHQCFDQEIISAMFVLFWGGSWHIFFKYICT